MLHCPPSRINLTSFDIADFERRFTARQHTRNVAVGLRITTGPGRLTQTAFVHASDNLGRERAESCSSQATICSDEPTSSLGTPAEPFRLDGVVEDGHHSSPQSAPKGSQPSRTHQATQSLQVAPEQRRSPLTSRRSEAQKDTRADPSVPPRTRRQLDRDLQHNIRVFGGYPDGINAHVEERHPGRLVIGSSRYDSPQPASQHALDLSLNPYAPTFVPRTRFGSTSRSADSTNEGFRIAGQQGSSVDHSQLSSHLRLRSSFERNSQHASAERQLLALPPVLPPPHRHRRRSRTTDQNDTALQRGPNVDRYPPMRPPRPDIATSDLWRHGISHQPVVFPRRRSSRQHLLDYERPSRPQDVVFNHQNESLSRNDNLLASGVTQSQLDGLRPASPAPSTSSRSTPNLLYLPRTGGPRVHARSSLLTWNERTDQQLREDWRVASMVSAASGISEMSGDHPSKESSTAVEELFLNRNSPLDELTQQLSRMATNRPRSVGRSFDHPPGNRTRVILLAGNPFKQESSPERPLSNDSDDNETLMPHSAPKQRDSVLSMTDDPVALALALPPQHVHTSPSRHPPAAPGSSPPLQTTPSLPNTPATRNLPSSSPPSMASPSSEAISPRSFANLSRSLSPLATPRVTVYNDARPSELQPQTPADVSRSTARRHFRTGTTTQRAATREVLTGSPLTGHAMEESTTQRHTYPSATPPPFQVREEGIMTGTPDRIVITNDTTVPGRHWHAEARIGNSAENDFEGAEHGLEEDGRFWNMRYGDASLDVTPPADGRSERYYLS